LETRFGKKTVCKSCIGKLLFKHNRRQTKVNNTMTDNRQIDTRRDECTSECLIQCRLHQLNTVKNYYKTE